MQDTTQNLKDYTLKIGGVKTSYHDIIAGSLYGIHKSRNEKHHASKNIWGSTFGTFATAMVASYGAQYAFNQLNEKLLPSLAFSIVLSVGFASKQLSQKFQNARQARALDKAVVLKTGDATEAKYKSTIKELSAQGFLQKEENGQETAYKATYKY